MKNKMKVIEDNNGMTGEQLETQIFIGPTYYIWWVF